MIELGRATEPPVAEPTRRDRLRARWSPAASPVVSCCPLHFRDPHASGSWGFCPWLALTGLYCPGCGGLRAVNDLTNGDLLGALEQQPGLRRDAPADRVLVGALDPARMVGRATARPVGRAPRGVDRGSRPW